ncbi:SDR family NAD(P)-dependent oxidoreductase [Actinomadura logoneensis]|uniref:SDR family NAD(P)-dependent oxidoreductase n=1 Tax=Actinomadura logoneensis TaxID=2293572 RepID=A0A372JDH8_9ACTN|nr:SDR family NAD(P)-dependent oxidoreductase [Actinomadura logoneensis]RFU38020.1 SDR family NAD(P)-dependent oxidoreductase [Actinomadura logoneensis]
MLVTVTGGSGFLGSHTVAELVRRGHRVRLLARSAARVDAALGPLGVDRSAVRIARGDVTDAASVRRAVEGADAVLHAAAVYSFDSRDRARIRAVNAPGTAVVLEAAVRAGVPRVVHVSTVGALFPARGRELSAASPVGTPRGAYLRGKADAERVARSWQERGAPVAISYPPALLGPHDPRLGDQTARLRAALRGLMPVWPSGGFPVGDVRDTAAAHVRLLERPPAPSSAPERVFGPSRYLPTQEYLAVAREVTGRRLPALVLPARAVLPVGVAADLVQPAWPWHIPAEFGAVYTCAHAAPVAADADTCGVAARPVRETVADTVRWLAAEGLLTRRQAGRAARPTAVAADSAGAGAAGAEAAAFVPEGGEL